MGDQGSIATAGVGTVVLNVIVHGKTRKIKLETVLHVSTMGFNLMLVGMMEERGAAVSFKGGKAIIKISDKVFACGTRKSGLYHLDMAPLSDIAAAASLQLWHERLGHVNVAGVKRMIKNKDIDGLKCSCMVIKDVCEPCVYGKAAMKPMPSAGGGRVSKHLQLVHSDLGGPMSEPSRGGALYFGTFTDDFSRWTDVVFLQKKSDLLSEYKKWLTRPSCTREPRSRSWAPTMAASMCRTHSRLFTMRTARRTRPRYPTRRSRTKLLSGSTEFSWRWLAP